MTKDERIKKAVELLREAIDCLKEDGGYARVGPPVKYNKEKGQEKEEKVQCPACGRWISIKATGCVCELEEEGK